MKLTVISGSHRKDAQSLKVAKYIERRLRERELCEETWLYSLSGNPLPLWDESIWAGDEAWQARLSPISEQLKSSDGFVVIAPEWHGQVPAGLKNFFLMWTSKNAELAHKPALIVTVSSADGGAYPVAELRMSSYKNSRICYLPEHVIIRNVESVLNDDPDANNESADSYFRARIDYALALLKEYSVALKGVRASGAAELKAYPNGM